MAVTAALTLALVLILRLCTVLKQFRLKSPLYFVGQNLSFSGRLFVFLSFVRNTKEVLKWSKLKAELAALLSTLFPKKPLASYPPEDYIE